jgi:hypothetical protein
MPRTVEVHTLQGNLFLEDLALQCGGMSKGENPQHKMSLEELKREIKLYRLDSKCFMQALQVRGLVVSKLLKYLLEHLYAFIGGPQIRQPDLGNIKSVQDCCRGAIQVLEQESKKKGKASSSKDDILSLTNQIYSVLHNLDAHSKSLKVFLNSFLDDSSQKKQFFILNAAEESQENYICTFARFMKVFLKSADDFRGYSSAETSIFLAEHNFLLNMQILCIQ